jgi:hypothetical protein
MTRDTIRNLVIDTTGRSDKTDLINSAINIALGKVSSERLWNDLLTEATATLTIGDIEVALATDLRRLSEIRLMDGLNSYSIIVRPKTWLVQHFPDSTAFSSGKPQYAYLQGTTLFLVRPPDDTYTIRYSYYRLHPDLTDDVTSTLIPQADEALISYTTYWVFKSIEKHEDAQQWLADYTIQISDAKRVDRSSAIQNLATPRGSQSIGPDYWVDPFVKNVPRGF